MQSGGFNQAPQPGIGPQAPGGYGYGTYPQPVFGEQAQQYAAQQQNAAARRAPGAGPAGAARGQPLRRGLRRGRGPGGGARSSRRAGGGRRAPGGPGGGPGPAAAPAAGPGYGAAPDPTQQQQPATGGGAFYGVGGGYPGYGTNPFAGAYGNADPNAGVTGQNASAQGALDQTMVRTPGVIEGFKQGQGIGSTGHYGYASQLQAAGRAVIDPAQVRMQNLKATRKMSPVARGVVQSFAAAGGTDKDTFDFYADKKGPGSSTAGTSYSMR